MLLFEHKKDLQRYKVHSKGRYFISKERCLTESTFQEPQQTTCLAYNVLLWPLWSHNVTHLNISAHGIVLQMY